MLSPTRLAIIALAFVLGLAGCATLGEHEQAKKLEASVRNYVLAVRWGTYGAAAQHLRRRDGNIIKPDLKALEEVRVTQYEYAIDARQPGAPEARMTASFEYYYLDTRSVRKTYQQSLWWWDEKSKSWYMDDNLPSFPRK